MHEHQHGEFPMKTNCSALVKLCTHRLVLISGMVLVLRMVGRERERESEKWH